MKRKPNNEKTTPTKKQKKEGKSTKNEALPPDVRTLWAKSTSSQAPLPVTPPDNYETGDSDFEDPSLAHTRSVCKIKSSNPPESKPPD